MKTREVLDLLVRAQQAAARADRSVILNRLTEAFCENKRYQSKQPKGCSNCLRALMNRLFWDSLNSSANALILCAPLFLDLCCESGIDWAEFQKLLLDQATTVKG